MCPGGAGIELLAHADVPLVRRHLEAGVKERVGLLGDRVDDGRLGVADVHDRDSRTHVDQLVAVDIFHDPAVRQRDEQRQRRADRIRDGAGAALPQLA